MNELMIDSRIHFFTRGSRNDEFLEILINYFEKSCERKEYHGGVHTYILRFFCSEAWLTVYRALQIREQFGMSKGFSAQRLSMHRHEKYIKCLEPLNQFPERLNRVQECICMRSMAEVTFEIIF